MPRILGPLVLCLDKIAEMRDAPGMSNLVNNFGGVRTDFTMHSEQFRGARSFRSRICTESSYLTSSDTPLTALVVTISSMLVVTPVRKRLASLEFSQAVVSMVDSRVHGTGVLRLKINRK